MRVTTLYSALAPVYDRFRPWWIAALADEAERCLETEILPRCVTPKTTMLDIGCGTGVNLARLARLGLACKRYVGLDLTPAMLARARRQRAACWVTDDATHPHSVSLARGDMRHLPFRNAAFDFVLSTWALEHVPAAEPVLQEALRTLRPGGQFVLLCHSCPPGRRRWLLRLTEGLLLMHSPVASELQADAQILCRRFAGGLETLAVYSKPLGHDDPQPARSQPSSVSHLVYRADILERAS